jgi:hypothetical protein
MILHLSKLVDSFFVVVKFMIIFPHYLCESYANVAKIQQKEKHMYSLIFLLDSGLGRKKNDSYYQCNEAVFFCESECNNLYIIFGLKRNNTVEMRSIVISHQTFVHF